MSKRMLYLLAALTMLASLVSLSACQPTPEPAAEEPIVEKPTVEEPAVEEPAVEEPAAEVGFDWRQLEGTKITVFLSETPMAQAIRAHVAEFEELTGIDVDYLVVSESEYWSKLTVDLSSGAGQFHVFMSGPTLNWGYASAGQIQPLDPFMEDPTITPEEWDFDDFFPWAIESNMWDMTPGIIGMGKGSLWSIPTNEVNNLITYRKDLFDEWGLEPPDTWAEWVDTAHQIMDITGGELDGKPFYAVAQRGALDLTTLSGPFFSGFASYGGRDFNDDLTPAMNDERAVEFQELYIDTIKETGSPEWPNMMWFDVQQGFTSGQYAMVFDCDNFVPTYEGEGSVVAGKLAYALLPAGPDGDRISHPWTWGFSMNSQTKDDQAKAAWLFIVWASSKEQMVLFAPTGSWPTRLSVWEDPDVRAVTDQWGDGSFREAMDEVLGKYTYWPISPLIDAGAIQLVWVEALHDYYFGKGDMQTLMDGVAERATEILQESGTVE
jgi:multiple sugar transport system substrate-binding protein